MILSQFTVSRPLLFVIGSAEIGGAEKQLIRLTRELKSRGVNVEVAFTQAAGPLISELNTAGIPWRVFPIRLYRDRLRSIVSVGRFCFYLAFRRPRIVNAWLPESAVIALPLVRIILPKTLRVASVRGNPVGNSRGLGFAYKKVLRASDRVLLNASHLAKIVVENFGISPERVEVIPNGVSIPEYVSDVSLQPPTAVVIANFHSYKGHLLLLEALAKVTTPIKVRLCGIGSTHTDIDEAISALGLASVVTIVDSPADIASELRDAQFAIHPSTTEGLSNAILEELASGLPVIAFDIDGNLPLISHGENGLLVKQSDVEQLARAIGLMAADGELRIQLASGARASAEKYSWESSASKYEKTFSELIANSRITD